jgi:hypothetical protein
MNQRNSINLKKQNLELPVISRPRFNSEVFISKNSLEPLKFSNKYLKEDLNKVKLIKSQIITMLTNKDFNKETKKVEFEVLPNFRRKLSDSSDKDVKLFCQYRYQAKTKNKLEIKSEHPYFIINSRLPDTVLDNQHLMNNIFNKNMERISRLNTE